MADCHSSPRGPPPRPSQTSRTSTAHPHEMTEWNQADLERLLDCSFERVDCEPGIEWLQAGFSSRGLRFTLVIDAPREWIWLRSDPINPDQATPAFEFYFRSDRIRVTAGDYDSEAARFEFAGGDPHPTPRHTRLVIERLPCGALYVWPVIGSPDPPHPGHDGEGFFDPTPR
jgi:hypothetical protein